MAGGFLLQIYLLINMTTYSQNSKGLQPATNISIQDFTQREIVYCISPLIFALTQEKQCLDEDLALELWQGQINFTEAEYVINNDGSYLGQKNNLWGLYDNGESDNPIVDYKYETKESLIEYYFEDMSGEDDKWNLENCREQIFEHWIVTPYLATKLKEEGETVCGSI